MANKKNQSEKVNMTTSIDKGYYKYLQKISFKLSAKENKKIGLSEVVRRALIKYYPFKGEK